MKKSYRLLCLLFALMLANPIVFAADEPTDVSIEGLKLVHKDNRGELYVEEGVDWNEYTQIKLEPATVAFRKYWKRDQNRSEPFKVTDQDMERIKSGLSDLFNEVFTEELTQKGGYTITETNGADVMTLVPQIVDLDVAAPDTRNNPGMSRSYVNQAGRMTLILEIYDSESGDLLAKGSHRQDAPQYTYMRWASSVSNTVEARRMLQKWADKLVKRLDEARKETATPAAAE